MASASFKSRLENEVDAGKLYCHSNVYSPFSLNKDYSLEIEDVRNYDDLCEKVRDCYEEYDPDYETYLWKSSDGHGINGAPYHIRDILAEHDLIDSKLSGLLFALRFA